MAATPRSRSTRSCRSTAPARPGTRSWAAAARAALAPKLIDQTDNSEIAAADLARTRSCPVSVGSWTERYKAKPGRQRRSATIDGVAPTRPRSPNGSFPFSPVHLQRVLRGDPTNGNKCGTRRKAARRPPALHRRGRLDLQGRHRLHVADPTTGVDYRTEIANVIKQVRLRAAAHGRHRWRHDSHQLLPAVTTDQLVTELTAGRGTDPRWQRQTSYWRRTFPARSAPQRTRADRVYRLTAGAGRARRPWWCCS